MLSLDGKTMDLKLTYGSLLAAGDYSTAALSTKSVAVGYDEICFQEGRVPATKYNYKDEEIKEMSPERRYELGLDYKVLNGLGWIQTLPNNSLEPTGIQCLKGYPHIRTNIHIGVIDTDVVSSYPSVIQAIKACKKTTSKELIDVIGIPEHVFRKNNLMIATGVDKVRYATEMYSVPSLSELENILEEV
jgi:hypothetical protein